MLQNGDCWLDAFSDQFTTADLSPLGAPEVIKIHPETDELTKAVYKCGTCSGRLVVAQCGRGKYKLTELPDCTEMVNYGLDPTRTEDLIEWQHTTPPHGTPVIESEVTTAKP